MLDSSDTFVTLYANLCDVPPIDCRWVAGFARGRWNELDSTNLVGAELARVVDRNKEDRKIERWAIRADHQSGGLGQHGRSWTDVAGRDLCLSAVLTGGLQTETAWMLNMKVCLALADVVEQLIDESGASGDVQVKWPNDLFVGGRKISGVLIETTWRGKEMASAVVGMGLNMGGQPPYPNATSLEAAGLGCLKVDVVEQLVLEALAARLDRTDGPAALIAAYNAKLFGQGQAQRWMLDGEEVRGVLDHIDIEGRMWLKGDRRAYVPGEASWLGFEPDCSRRISQT
jgi:BirA family biotin operon repressor/biotin-[acetyl-CoA-carboxylase] ligase